MSEFSQPIPPYIIPVPQPEAEEIFAVYQTTQAFYREVQQREAFEAYCQWYYETAHQHRQDLEKMKKEPNLMAWFTGRTRK